MLYTVYFPLYCYKVLIQKVAVFKEKISSPVGNFLYPSIFKLQKYFILPLENFKLC